MYPVGKHEETQYLQARAHSNAGWYRNPAGVRELASFGKEVADRTPG